MEHILDILDPDEQSRLEDGDDYLLTILRLPIYDPSSDPQYSTCPLGIILKNNYIITICWTDCEVLRDFTTGRMKGITLQDFPAFIMRILSRSDLSYLRYLKEINRRSTAIQNEMQLSIDNNEILQLLSLEKSLVYFTTSLKANQLLLEKYRKTKLIKLDLDDIDWLDDVEIDNRQAMEMAATYTNIMAQMNDASASLISNNLSIVMKRMTIISLVMMIPTFITSFFGMNVPLPWMHTGFWGMLFISIICIAAAVAGWYIIAKTSKYASPIVVPRRKKFRQRRNERKQKKYIKNQEKLAEKSRGRK